MDNGPCKKRERGGFCFRDGIHRFLPAALLALVLHASILSLFFWDADRSKVAFAPPAAMKVELSMLVQAPASNSQLPLPAGPTRIETVATKPKPKPKPKPEPEEPESSEPAAKPEPDKVQLPPLPKADRSLVPVGKVLDEKDRKEPKSSNSPVVESHISSAAPGLPAPSADEVKANRIGHSSSMVHDMEKTWESEVLSKLEKLKRYPGYARRMGQQDVVYMRFHIDRSGQLLDYAVDSSNGYQLLDEEARALIQRATPFPPPPESVPGKKIELVVPVVFFLHRA